MTNDDRLLGTVPPGTTVETSFTGTKATVVRHGAMCTMVKAWRIPLAGEPAPAPRTEAWSSGTIVWIPGDES